jgi:hypothetical protein
MLMDFLLIGFVAVSVVAGLHCIRLRKRGSTGFLAVRAEDLGIGEEPLDGIEKRVPTSSCGSS